MKQFLVLCAVLPLMLVIIIQITMDQITGYKISAINQAVYSAKERAQQEGYFSDDIVEDLNNQIVGIGFDQEDISLSFDDYDSSQNIGTLLNYMVSVNMDNTLVKFMTGENSYHYVIDSCTVSQYVVVP